MEIYKIVSAYYKGQDYKLKYEIKEDLNEIHFLSNRVYHVVSLKNIQKIEKILDANFKYFVNLREKSWVVYRFNHSFNK